MKEKKLIKIEIFCRYIKKKGRIIYPKNAKFFHFWITKYE